MLVLLFLRQILTADNKDRLTVLGLPEAVSHFKQPFNAASITVNWASIRR